jgi:hypothetical protein
MRRIWIGFGICLCLNFGLGRAAVPQNAYDKYLTAADVEKVTGMKGVKAIARGSVSAAGGDLNFADAAGELILMVQFTDAKKFAGFKTKYASSAVPGVGDQAVQGAVMPGMPDNLLAFTKGAQCVVLTAFADFTTNRVYLKIDQLSALGKLIASRI